VHNIIFYLMIAFSYANACINPFIYAARYEVFKRAFKKMLGRSDDSTQQQQYLRRMMSSVIE